MGIWENSFSVLVQDWNSISAILCMFFLGGGIAFWGLKIVLKDSLTQGEIFALSAGGGILAFFLGILPIWFLNLVFGIKINLVFCLIIFMIGILAIYWLGNSRVQSRNEHVSSKNAGDKQSISTFLAQQLKSAPALVLVLILIISIYLRLGFISRLVVPLYFDSAMHYSIIRDLTAYFETATLPTYNSYVGGYYHLGFHVLITSFSLSLNLAVKDVILIFGQIILALIPLPLFFMIRQATKLDAPGLFAVLLAGWGWSMPQHAVDWGKYPALTSILAFELVICCASLLRQAAKPQRWIVAGLFGFSLFTSTFIHTRSLVLVLITLISVLLALGWNQFPRFARRLTLILVITGLLTLIFILQAKPILNLVFDPYQVRATLLILLLTPFALKKFPVAAFSNLLAIVFLLGSLLISVTGLLPVYEAQTLLDRPFVEMILFLPLAFLGGLGCAGVVRTINGIALLQDTRKKWLNGLVTLFLFGAVLANLTQYNFSPSECCQLFGEEDAAALAWMDAHLPLNATILVSSAEAIVFESNKSAGYTGSDGGIWIEPLIQRNVTLFPFQTDFGTQETLDELCKQGLTHIYAGGRKQSFEKIQLQDKPAWYETSLRLPKTQVYRVVGCP